MAEELNLIWHTTLTLCAFSLAMFGVLILRRGWHELRSRQMGVRRRTIRHKIFLLLDLDPERFARRCTAPGYFTRKEHRLLHEESLALCQILKGSDQERAIDLMRRLHFQRDELLDLQRGSEDLRYAAAIGLQYFNHASTRAALLAALEDRSEKVTLAAANSLQVLQALPPVDTLLVQLAERGLLQAAACRTLFHRIALHSPDTMIQAERSFPEQPAVRALLAEGMGYASNYSILPCLERLARDPAPGVRIEALGSLRRLEHPAASTSILHCLVDVHWEVRSAAIMAAGELGVAEALPKLESMLDSDNWILRFNSALGLYQLGVAGRRVLLRRTRKADIAGRTANLVLSEKGVASGLPGR